jgi:hypothetical protein
LHVKDAGKRSPVSDEMLILLGLMGGALAFLIWMLFSVRVASPDREKAPIRGYCPICGHDLRKGEQMRSNQLQIGKAELRTFIRGCPFCLAGKGKRLCPVCKKKLSLSESAVAFSNPSEDKNRLSIRGCKKCYPQAYEGTSYD